MKSSARFLANYSCGNQKSQFSKWELLSTLKSKLPKVHCSFVSHGKCTSSKAVLKNLIGTGKLIGKTEDMSQYRNPWCNGLISAKMNSHYFD